MYNRVTGRTFLERSGNSALAARELPVEEVLASEGYIRALAAYLRSHGVQLGQREAEVTCYLDLTQGRDPLDRIPPSHRDLAGRDHGSRDGAVDETAGEPGGGAASNASDAGHRGGAGADGDSGAWRGEWRRDAGGHVGQRHDCGSDGDDRDSYYEDDDDCGDQGDGGGQGGDPWPVAPAGPGRPGGRAPFPATINLLVPVGSAYGWSTMPGEADREIIDPQTLRAMMQAASRHPATRWCVTLIDADRTAVAHGCARGRHDWDPPPDGELSLGHLAEFLARLKVDVEPIARDSCDHRHAEPGYRPSRKLRHLILARNATCPAPGCQASSSHSDLDHTRPWPEGSTDECDLGPPCRHHHRAKQAPGWTLEQPAPGTFRWTTPSGRTYQTGSTRYDV